MMPGTFCFITVSFFSSNSIIDMKEVVILQDKLPELLAPAGRWEALAAAVQNGADAVYLGSTRFNARRLADNFNNDNLRKAVEYAHLYGVRIYVAVNILIKEKELEELKAFLKQLEEFRVDGVIVQDLGAARLVRQYFPKLSLHASTQMTIHQLEGVKILEDMGFDRVILSRELTLEEIKYISENTSLELESFVHGALCVSYSGQCLMSSMLGGRSGNRGMCAQPCRLAYTLNKGQDPKNQKAYHLSMRDLSAQDFLQEILAAGVSSFKIEGRMKRPEYVAVVTREYRKALDSILETGEYKPEKAAAQELEQIFNRGGFTKGYYYGTDHKTLYSKEKPNNWGVFLGRVQKLDKGLVWISLEDDLEAGDGIEFWTQKNGNKGQIVNNILINGRHTNRAVKGQTAAISSSVRPEPGCLVYRTSKAAQLKEAEISYKNNYSRKIPISACAVIRFGEKPVLTVRDDIGLEGKASCDYQVQRALNAPLDENIIRIHLDRLGDTPFKLTSLKLQLDGKVFVPVSVLNQLRKDAIKDLIIKRTAYFDDRALKSAENRMNHSYRNKSLQDTAAVDKLITSRKPMLNGYIDHLSFDPEVFTGLDTVSFTPSSFSFKWEQLRRQVNNIKDTGISVRLVLPAITRKADMDLLRNLPDELWTLFDDYQIGNLGQLMLLKEKGIDACYGSHTLNVANSLSLAQLAELGLKGVTLSPELTMTEIRDIMSRTLLPCEILVFGRLVLMTLEYCPHHNANTDCNKCRFMGTYTLTDRKGYSFSIRKKRISRCYSELLNSQPIFLADNMYPFHELSAFSWGLILEGLPYEECRQVIQIYRYALDYPGTELPRHLADFANRFKQNGFTKGHFYRGVE